MRAECYFRSLHGVTEVKTDFIPVIYWDDDGEEKVYTVPIWVRYADGKTEWIEIKPQSEIMPIKKYLYAHHISKMHGAKFRGLTDEESEIVTERT
jgi:hypothetical protein